MGSSLAKDAELISASAAGSVDAFTALVERYRSLVCAVSFSATGDPGLSEDVAQETFLVAWKDLTDLRDPKKLRPWLCGIARNLSAKALRKTSREVPCDSQSLGESAEASSTPLESALVREQGALAWEALQAVPEAYRETLVLFYREEQSTKEVAGILGLSENAVQQRLSRGRQHLKTSVLARSGEALTRTKPGAKFVTGVVAAISAGAVPSAEAQAASALRLSRTVRMLAIAKGLLTMKGMKLAALALLLLALGVGGTAPWKKLLRLVKLRRRRRSFWRYIGHAVVMRLERRLSRRERQRRCPQADRPRRWQGRTVWTAESKLSKAPMRFPSSAGSCSL